MRFKKLMTWSPREKKLRLFRVIWERGTVGNGHGYSACFSLALMPKLFKFERGFFDRRFILLGVSFHCMRSYGGRFA